MTFETLKELAFGRITISELSQELVKDLGNVSKNEATAIAEAIKISLEATISQGDSALDERIQEIENSIKSGAIKNVIDAVSTIQGQVKDLQNEDTRLAEEIEKLKSTVSGKNNPTQVFDTMEEFNEYNTRNQENLIKGDMVYVISVKKSYIYNPDLEIMVLELPTPPEGWMFFDEISSDLDLSDLKDSIEKNKTDITTLNGDENVEGSVAFKIKQVKDALDAVDVGLRTDVDQAKKDILANAAAIAEVAARKFILTRKQELIDAIDQQTVYELTGTGVSENFIVDVFVNSVRLVEGEDKDYTLAGKTLTLKKARSAGSVIQVLFTFVSNAPQA